MEKHTIVDLMHVAMTKIHEMTDVNTIVGDAVSTPDGTTIIPVSKVSYGFAAGGTDWGKKEAAGGNNFGGGSGAGITLTPVSFLVITPKGVNMLPVTPAAGTSFERIVDMIPGVVTKITSLFKKEEEE